MEWWSRLVGGAPTRAAPKNAANDPEVRLARFKRNYHTVLALCNRPRNLTNEGPVLEQLHALLERIDVIIREDSRAPVPHLCLQFSSSNQIYTLITRAAVVSQSEPIIQVTVSVLAALIDSEEEDFLSNAFFAKSLMRLATRVLDGGQILVSSDTETAILELLFTITAKIRLQPEILPFWFRSTARQELEDVFVKEKKSFVGITQKEDFPLCYILIDRVHHGGQIGDFARTGLLYIFEATGRSIALEEWIVSSDLPTLMASGLGALYSQLSRELSILHPDSTLPAVLAMSDYTTTHPRATAESAFSQRHQSDMATFLSYLAFWQDVLDHCKSADVKQTLLDHFQILFLQQLLYPSLLQSSDTDAGSSVAVLTYMLAMLESLEYVDLMNMMLAYLLAVKDESTSSYAHAEPPRSPTSVRRRQSLLLLTAPENPEDAVEPTLFSLVDLIVNNVSSSNSQSVFAALKLASSLLMRQKKFAFGTLLRVQRTRNRPIGRTLGALELEIAKLAELTASLHDQFSLDDAYLGLVEDVRSTIEAQVASTLTSHPDDAGSHKTVGRYVLPPDEYFLRTLRSLLGSFFTNSIDVNLALTEAVISIALCTEVRLDGWLAVDPATYTFQDNPTGPTQVWQSHLEDDERTALSAIGEASRRPMWLDDNASLLHSSLRALAHELDTIRTNVPNLDHLIAGRKNMLQATSLDAPLISSDPPSLMNSPTHASFLDVPKILRGKSHSRSSSASSQGRGRKSGASSASPSPAASPGRKSAGDDISRSPARSIFQPPPPDMPSTTDVLMQRITFPDVKAESGSEDAAKPRTATLNHILTNVVVLQEFALELIAVLQARAAVLGEAEVRLV